jgi:hypothetical protein
MKVSNGKFWKFATMAGVAMAVVLCAAMIRMEAAPRKSARAGANRAAADDGYISGTVTSAKGPEAGVWVIAETSDLGTKFRKIVVTDDEGKYLLPDLPKANYKVWVRGYGLVDSEPVEATPGKTLPLAAVVAPSARAAAEFYPADYWASRLAIPRKSDFPMTVPDLWLLLRCCRRRRISFCISKGAGRATRWDSNPRARFRRAWGRSHRAARRGSGSCRRARWAGK